MLRTSIFIAASIFLAAHTETVAQTITQGAKSNNSTEGMINVRSRTQVVITATLNVHGNGDQANPESTLAIDVGGQECARTRASWHDHNFRFQVSCNMSITGPVSFKAYEVSNTRATADSINITAQRANTRSAATSVR